MRSKHLLLMLLLALMAPWAANAQSLFSENFEGGSMPTGWTQEGTYTWSVGTGVNGSYPSSAGQGTYNAKIYGGSYTSGPTKLITPEIDLSSATSAELSFMHVQVAWDSDIDELRVYYRTSSTGSWTLLDGQEYTDEVGSWTTEDGIVLPNLSGTYQLAFEYSSNYGRGLGIDDVRIVQGSACVKPSTFQCTATTTNTATFSWTENGEATAWQICIDDDEEHPIDANSNPFTLTTGLEAGTAYTAKVRANCGGGSYSGWTTAINFQTKCNPIIITTYWSENFDGITIPSAYTPSSRTLPSTCWRAINTTTDNDYKYYPTVYYYSYTNYANSTPNCLRFLSYSYDSYGEYYDPQDQWVILPEMEGLAGKQITLSARGYNSSSSFRVGLISNPDDLDTFEEITTSQTLTTSYQEFTYYIPTSATAHYVAIMIDAAKASYGSYSSVYNGVYIDDITISETPTCFKPQNLTASNVAARTATLTWEKHPMGTETAWTLQIATNNTFTTGLQEFEVSTTPTKDLTGLTPETEYFARVKPACDTEGQLWSDVEDFTTAELCPPPTLYSPAPGSITAYGATFVWAYGTSDSYKLLVGKEVTTTHNSYDFEDNAISDDFSNSTDYPWTVASGGANNSNKCVIPGNQGVHSSDSDLTLEVNLTQPATISFYAKISSEGSDYGRFLIDETQQLSISGTYSYTTWAKYQYELTAGTHTLIWRYHKDISVNSGDDCFYVDEITITSSSVPTWITYENVTTPYELFDRNNIEPETTYNAKIVGVCESVEGNPSNVISFTTDVACHVPTEFNYSNVKSNKVDLTWESDATAWQICVNNASTYTDLTSSTTGVTVEEGVVTYQLTGLTPLTPYSVKVRANCSSSNDGYSEWTDNISFTTYAACALDNVTVNNIGHYTATVNWDGESEDGFIVKYRTAATMNNDGIDEDFEDGTMPNGWTQSGPGTWTVSEGYGYNSIGAHGGTYNVRIGHSDRGNETYLITPMLDLSGQTGATMNFWYINYNWGTNDIDQIYVYYRVNGGDWTELWNTTEDHQTWTESGNINLPNPSANYQIAFMMHDKYGHGVGLDDITIGTPTTSPAGAWQTENVTDATANLIDLEAGTKYEVTVAPICDEALVSDPVEFTTVADNVKLFLTEGDWATATNWDGGIPTIADEAIIKANATIANGTVAEAMKITFQGTPTPTLTIADGGQLKTDNTVTATVKKSITGYTGSKDHYYLIGNPLSSYIYVYNQDNTYNIRKGTYDLYSWSRTSDLEWTYYGANYTSSVYMYPGTGYLYANAADVELTFTGTVYANNIPLSSYVGYTEPTAGTTDFSDWNLLANPFVCDAYLVDASENGNALPYYKMNDAGDGFTAVSNGAAVAPMQGIFYKATEAGTVYCTRTAPGAKDGQLNMNLRSGIEQIDNAILVFGSEQKLEKFSFRANSSKIYMPVEGKDYAITNAEPQGEMPVSFKAENNGSYTLSFNTENVEFGYLHLIDNMTGEDVNLLETPSYSFEAKTTDYASRFKLVFSTDSSTSSETFAFISDGNIILNGEGMLQVVDVMGRIMMQEENATSVSTSGMTPGVYVLRLINGDSVRTQKIVVK